MANDTERQFLQRRQDRLAEQKSLHRHLEERKEHIQNFWSQARQDFKEWDVKLQNAVSATTTASLFETLEVELTTLCKKYLHKNHYQEEENENNNDIADEAELLLSDADVRSLHTMVAQHFQRLLQAQQQKQQQQMQKENNENDENIFRFHRYRAAMKSRQQKTGEENKEDIILQAPQNTVQKQHSHSLPISTIIPQGAFCLKDSKRSTLHDTMSPEAETPATCDNSRRSSCLVLQNLDECKVFIHGSYKALQICNVNQTTISIQNKVDGAIFVTHCTDVRLQGFDVPNVKDCVGNNVQTGIRARQLRLHESNRLHIHIRQMNSGPILEDCNDLVLYAAAGDNNGDLVTTVDFLRQHTKDFNWFQPLQPSPHFRVEEQPEIDHLVENPDSSPTITIDNTTSSCLSNDDNCEIQEAKDSDDEDEL